MEPLQYARTSVRCWGGIQESLGEDVPFSVVLVGRGLYRGLLWLLGRWCDSENHHGVGSVELTLRDVV